VAQNEVVDFEDAGRLGSSKPLTSDFDEAIVSPVVVLLVGVGPAAVSRLIVSLIVNPAQAPFPTLAGAPSHIIQEVLIRVTRVTPPVADRDAFTAVPLVAGRIYVIATLEHRPPGVVFFTAVIAMPTIGGSGSISVETATALNLSAY
jgi:hypothetical protein